MRLAFPLFLTLIVVLSSCGEDEKEEHKEVQKSCFFNTEAHTITHNGVDREYILYIPDSYDGATSVPVMLNFHGFGGSAGKYMLEADMRQVAEAETFILVYPQGSCSDGFAHWNPCPSGGDNKRDADDLGFVESLLDELSGHYQLDNERIYAVGYSNGGMMAYGLAQYKSELIAAVGSVSDAMLDCFGTKSHPMPVVHFHGTADEVIPYTGGGDYNSVQDVLDYWIQFNELNQSPLMNSDEAGGLTVEHFVYDREDLQVSLEHFKYVNGGHDWFEQKYQGRNTAQLLWDFLSKYDINGLR